MQQSKYSDVAIAAWFDSTPNGLSGARPRELIAADPGRVLASAQVCIYAERYVS